MKKIIQVTPIGKPRMTRRDRWAKRPCVVRYFEYKDAIKDALDGNFDTNSLNKPHTVRFYLPMPKSWSKKKKAEHDGQPHQQKPDIDNLLKALYDSVLTDDSGIWSVRAEKYWAYEGSIEIVTE